jgi:hypothetical protein
MDQMDEVELYDTFTEAEARRLGVVLLEEPSTVKLSTSGQSLEHVTYVAEGKGA